MPIEWPSSMVQELRDVSAKQTLTVTEPARLQTLGANTLRTQSWKGPVFDIRTSTDLRQWTPAATVTNLSGTLDYTMEQAALPSQRFYHAVSR